MTTKEKIAVMQAFLEGKPIQYKLATGSDTDWVRNDEPRWDWEHCIYRIKPQPKLRPYKLSEFIEALKKHGCFMFVIGSGECHYPVQYFDGSAIKVNDAMFTYDEVLKTFTWADDNSPCGILEE